MHNFSLLPLHPCVPADLWAGHTNAGNSRVSTALKRAGICFGLDLVFWEGLFFFRCRKGKSFQSNFLVAGRQRIINVLSSPL